MAITLPQIDQKILVARAIVYMKKLNLDVNSKDDIDSAIGFVQNAFRLCPDKGSGFSSIEITTNFNDDKVVLDQNYKKNTKQLLEGLELLKKIKQ